MYGFIGSSYFPEIKQGDILMIEDCLKDASIVEKNFAMLKLQGIFGKVSGIILGKHEQYDDLGTGKQPLDLLMEQLDGLDIRSEEHTSELQSRGHLVCRLLLEKKK